MAKKRKVKPLPKMTPKRRASINKKYTRYNKKLDAWAKKTPRKRR